MVANLLTVLRVALTPFIVISIMSGHFVQALIIFMVASATDLFDGMAARYFKTESDFGQKFDPVADKVLMGSTFFALAYANIVPWWFFGIVVTRDVSILLAALL